MGECSDIELFEARNRSTGLTRYLETWKVLWHLKKHHKPDLYMLGFRGHEMFWPVRWLARGKPLVFDALMSPSAALAEEKKAGILGQIFAPLMRWLELSILRNADLVLADTQQHVDFYARQFGVPRSKLLAVPVGAAERSRKRQAAPSFLDPQGGRVGSPTLEALSIDTDRQVQRSGDDFFSALFYGSMLPLHGVDVIVAAAAQLKDLPIRFDFIGGSAKQARRLRQLCERHGVTRYTHRSWVPLDELVNTEIPRADLCLGGPFGGTPQARRVITSKTSQALALGKATVIGAIDEDIGWIDKDNCLLVPQGNSAALATALRWAFAQRSALPKIGKRGQTLYQQKLSVHTIAQRLCPALRALQERRKTES